MPHSPAIAGDERAGDRQRILVLSTLAFTLLFAVWLMFGVLGLKIKSDLPLMLGEAADTMTAAEVKAAVNSRFEWLLAVAILSGSLFRLHFGIWTDRLGGKAMMIGCLLGCALPCLAVAYVQNYAQLLACAFLLGLAGNSFSVGIAWNSAWFPGNQKGMALGVFGAGNVGAAGTKLLVMLIPGILTLVPTAGYLGGWLPGGWRVVPVLYAVLLVVMAIATYAFCPQGDRRPGQGRPLAEMLRPIRHARVWRFGVYYVVVFGAYVALSAWLPNYYVETFQLDLRTAALLTALFIFPASLLRPLGGWLADRYGPRCVTYAVFLGMTCATIPLCLPGNMLALSATGFTFFMVLVGVGMGIGKASVYKYIPDYFPNDVGAVGGLVGLLGALGAFWLPKAFGWLGRETGFPQAAFLALLALSAGSLVWLHLVIRGLNVARANQALPVTETAASS